MGVQSRNVMSQLNTIYETGFMVWCSIVHSLTEYKLKRKNSLIYLPLTQIFKANAVILLFSHLYNTKLYKGALVA